MSAEWIPVVIAFIAAIPGIYAALNQQRKDRLDAGKLALEICEKQDKQIEKLEAQVKESEIAIEQLQNNNLELKDEISLIRNENDSLKREVVLVKHENELLKKEIDELRVENAELKEENQDLRDRLEVVEKRRNNSGSAK